MIVPASNPATLRRSDAVWPMLLVLALVFSPLLSGRVACQEPGADRTDAEVAKVRRLANRFLQSIAPRSEAGLETAFSELFAGSPLAESFREPTAEMQRLLEETSQIQQRFGRVQAIEWLDAKRLGEDVILLRYLFKCRDYPVLWYFTYYNDFSRSDGETKHWIVVSVRFDTDLEAARDYAPGSPTE